MRLIDADKMCEDLATVDRQYETMIDWAIRVTNAQPTVDAVPVDISTKQTNADRIRAMTDEELASFIGGIFTIERDVWGNYDPHMVVTQEPRVEIRDFSDMIEWLKEKVTE